MSIAASSTDTPGTVEPVPSPAVVVILPAHNEAMHIGSVIASIPAWVRQIIVVDDASSDDTATIAGASDDPRVRVLRRERNGGVGAAMRTGYRAALAGGCDLVAKVDADGQMRPDELERLVEPFTLGIADYAKGNRFYLRGATAGMPTHRGIGNALLSFLTKVASGYWHVYDSQCGFTVVRASFLRLLDLDDLPQDYFFENAMLIKLNALNARVVDVPVSTIYGEETSGISVHRVMVSFPPRLITGGASRFWRKHLVTDFGAIGALTVTGLMLSLFGLAFGSFHWWLSVPADRLASTGTVMIAVLPLMAGVQLLVQAFSMSVLSSPGAGETSRYVRQLIAEGRFAGPGDRPSADGPNGAKEAD